MSAVPFALLTYRTQNLGDDIQSAAVLNLLGPGMFLNRDEAAAWPPARIVMAGWWLESVSFPPPPCVETLPVGLHWQARSVSLLDQPFVRDWFLRQVEQWSKPIGARDRHTQQLLEERGIAARTIGCVSLTLPPYIGPRFGIVAIDVPPIPCSALQACGGCTQDIQVASQLDSNLPAMRPLTRMAKAIYRLALIQRASLVLTSRLHVLLPCVAFRTPVLFFGTDYQPERWRDYAILATGAYRWSDFTEVVHSLDLFATHAPPQPVPTNVHELRQRMIDLRAQWGLSPAIPVFPGPCT